MNNFFYSRLTTGLLLMLLAAECQAAQVSAPTLPVNGRPPVARPSFIGSAQVGNTITAISGFIDADGDAESGTSYSWNIGQLNLGSGAALIIPPIAGAKTITLSVTPKTNMAITDPAVGTASTKDVVVPPYLANFIKPDTIQRTWSQADAYCSGLGNGARLPTKDELVGLYLSATIGTVVGQLNDDMCTVHGWPLNGMCSGKHNFYKSSTLTARGHDDVVLSTGQVQFVGDLSTSYVACTR